jgi:hypothetical protein
VLAGRADAADWLRRSTELGRGNAIASALTARAQALLSADDPGLDAAGEAFAQCGASYQVERTGQLAARS